MRVREREREDASGAGSGEKTRTDWGSPELYKEADREDPKAVLDGVAVAGLVGILRQLGDLAE